MTLLTITKGDIAVSLDLAELTGMADQNFRPDPDSELTSTTGPKIESPTTSSSADANGDIASSTSVSTADPLLLEALANLTARVDAMSTPLTPPVSPPSSSPSPPSPSESSSEPPSSEPPAIATAAPNPGDSITLSEIFEASGKKHRSDAGAYRRSLVMFESCVRQYRDTGELVYLNPKVGDENRDNLIVPPDTGSAYTDHRITDPVVVSKIYADELDYFVRMLTNAGAAQATANKYYRYISSVLTIAFDRRLIDRKPLIKKLPKGRRRAKQIATDDLVSWWKATHDPNWRSTLWWQRMTILLACYGMRIGDASLIRWHGQDLDDELREGFYPSPVCPKSVVRNAKIESPFGWLCYTPEKQSDSKPEPLCLPVSSLLYENLIQTPVEERKSFICPVSPTHGYYRKNSKRFLAAWNTQLHRAEVPGDRSFDRHDCRRACKSTYTVQFGNSFLAGSITGHASRDETDKSYTEFAELQIKAVEEYRLNELFRAASLEVLNRQAG